MRVLWEREGVAGGRRGDRTWWRGLEVHLIGRYGRYCRGW